MKKVLLTAIAVFAFGFANAQENNSYKPKKESITTEVGLTGGLNNANFDLSTGVLKFRYFLKDDLALRAGFGLGSKKQETITGPDVNPTTTTLKNSNTQINLGVEKHFAGSDRLSTYAGVDLLIGFKGASKNVAEQNGNYQNTTGANGAGAKAGNFFGLRLLTGADYYIAKKVFLGVEIGLDIVTSKDKDIDVETKIGSAVVNSPTLKGASTFQTQTGVVGGVRIGYQF
ncbi:outer membrane beta-barrel protein [Flavobacterium psychrophilum]|nr:outer membrane beta-barrel protein [Flavobacterium psychrophilum]